MSYPRIIRATLSSNPFAQEVETINLYALSILIGNFMAESWKCLFFLVSINGWCLRERGTTRALYCNRDKTKDVIFSIILGFTAIFTELLLDVVLHNIYEIWPRNFILLDSKKRSEDNRIKVSKKFTFSMSLCA